MKTNPQRHFSLGPSVKLFRDEVDDILAILTSSCESTSISDDQYQYDSLVELQEKQGNSIKSISLAGHKPYVSLEIKRDLPYVILHGSAGDESLTAYTKIRELLQRHRRPILTRIFHPISAVLIIIFLISILAIADLKTGMRISKELVWLLVFGIGLSIMYLTFKVRVGGFSSVNLLRQHQRESFWAKNKDTILVAIIVAIISSLITLAITYFTTKQNS